MPSQTTAVARVLIVDDNASVAEAFSRTLRLNGYEVWAAPSADEGLTLAQIHHPHAVILDLRMPLAASLPLVRALRSIFGFESVPIAIVTGDYHLDREQEEELQALGAQVRFKPLWLDELVTLARDLVIPLRD